MNLKDFQGKSAPNLPLAPGCYMFLDKEGNVLYVGKSKCLRKRVASYFGNNKLEKFNVMLRFVSSVAFEETGTDIEALLLEHKLIKKHRPQYNSKMRRDNQNWYIKFDNGLTVTLESDSAGFFVGPFSHKESAIEVLAVLGKYFKLPTCNKTYTRMCLRGQMKNCFAPCENNELGDDNYQAAISFLQGNHDEVLYDIQEKMQEAIKKMEYENAAELMALFEELKRLPGFLASRVPNLAKKRFMVYLKSHHEDCFMLAYLDDGECMARVLLSSMHETDKIIEFAKEINYSKPIEDNKAFVHALVEISAIKKFYEIDKEPIELEEMIL